MIAPRMPGEQIRSTFLNGGGVPAFVSIVQNYSQTAQNTLYEMTESLGFSKAGVIEVSHQQEAEIDLFIEQFMAPTFFASVETAFELLLNKGYPKEAVCMELYYSGELGAVRTMMGRDGLYTAFKNNASPTCQYGVSSSRKLLWDHDMKDKALEQLRRITSGDFSRELTDKKRAEESLDQFTNSDTAKEIKAAADKYDISEGELEFFENYSKLVRSKIAITKTDRRLHEVLLILSGWYEAVHSELGLPAPAEDDKLDIDQILEQAGAPEGEGDVEIGENEE